MAVANIMPSPRGWSLGSVLKNMAAPIYKCEYARLTRNRTSCECYVFFLFCNVRCSNFTTVRRKRSLFSASAVAKCGLFCFMSNELTC